MFYLPMYILDNIYTTRINGEYWLPTLFICYDKNELNLEKCYDNHIKVR